MSRAKPYPNISPYRNKAVMDVNLNNYDLVFVKPIADKVDMMNPVVFVKEDGTEVEVNKLVVTDYSKATYNDSTKTLTLDLRQSSTGAVSFTDLIGVPNRLPTIAELKTGNSGAGAENSKMFLVAKEDGIYFENHSTALEIEPRRSRSKEINKIEELENRLKYLEDKLIDKDFI